jgi:NADPH:quinone reductase-like Zn-dependent oxidoreductase
MKAVLFNQHGDPGVLELTEIPIPVPGPGQVLVHLKAAALNRLDLWVRRGWPGIRLDLPHIPGADGAGEVIDRGPGVSRFQLGEQVVINANLNCGVCEFCIAGLDNRCRNWQLLGETVSGTYTEYIALPEQNLLPVPPDFDLRAAAAAGLVFHTAWHSLVKRGRVQPGERVLVVGAAGGVNTACIQIAHLAGAIVYGVGSNNEKLKIAESLGADYLIDRSKDELWAKTVYQITGGRGVDLVVDNVGTTFPHSFRAAAKGGRILTVGSTGGPKFEIDNRFIFARHLSVLGSTMGTRKDFAEVMELVFSRRLKAVLDRDFPLAQAVQAHEHLENDKQMGKVTLSIP